jgi:hypothetical protein
VTSLWHWNDDYINCGGSSPNGRTFHLFSGLWMILDSEYHHFSWFSMIYHDIFMICSYENHEMLIRKHRKPPFLGAFTGHWPDIPMIHWGVSAMPGPGAPGGPGPVSSVGASSARGAQIQPWVYVDGWMDGWIDRWDTSIRYMDIYGILDLPMLFVT